jgi:type IV pilus assembly protein PilO
MTLSLNKLPWYGQLGVFFALAALATGAFWNYYVKPTEESIASRRQQLASLQAAAAQGQATARRLPEFRREVAALEGQLDRLRTVLPEEKDVADLLRRIQAMATQSNLNIRGFVPQAVTAQELYAEWPIGLQLEGTYHNLGRFLERVSKFPRIINVTAINIRAKEGAPGETISADCTATTFVMTEPAPPAPPAARGRRGAPPPPPAARTE